MPEMSPAFRVLQVSPGPKWGLWSYFSNGACDLSGGQCGTLEFFIASAGPQDSLIELITAAGYYHHTRTLGLHHTLPIGHPWVPGATLDHLLVSKPYPLGPALEICEWEGNHIHMLWLLPITEAERQLKTAQDIEALESRFDEAGIHYWDPQRSCVVSKV